MSLSKHIGKLAFLLTVPVFTMVPGMVTAQEDESSETKPSENHVQVPVSSDWTNWRRPVDNPVFTTKHGNNHDSILFVDTDLEYPYHLIVSHEPSGADLWRTDDFSWSSSSWELVSDEYNIGGHYEYDDGVQVNGTYYIFEAGNVYTYSGPLEEADGEWTRAGGFPADECGDLGVYYEDGVFHIFGEYGHFPHGPDGTSLSHFTSPTGLGDWKLQDTEAVDPNPDNGSRYGVGDPTIAKINGEYYIYCDRESKGSPYKVIGWKSKELDSPFEYLGKVIQPRSGQEDDWDNYRIQDADIGYIPDLSRYVMTCNMKDHDGNPGGDFPNLGDNNTRVVGMFYSEEVKRGD